MSRYALYLRRSRADEEAEARGEGETLTRHRTALLDLARRKGLPVVQIYQEIASGDTIAGRPEMKRLLADVAARRYDGVLCMSVDRLGRGDSMDQGRIMQTFLYSGTCIVTPEKTYDPSNQTDFEFFEMRQFFARREYASIKSRMQAGRELASKEGCFVGSRPPYGYRIVPTTDGRSYTLAVLPDQAAIVRQIYDWYVFGADGREPGCRSIAARLNQMGICTAPGNRWTESTVRRLIMNPAYKGEITWAKRTQQITMQEGRRVARRVLNPNPIRAKGLHEPLVDEALWTTANARLHGGGRAHVPAQRETAFLFAGLMKCALCGKAIIRQSNPTRPEYDLLKCSTPDCPTRAAYVAAVERLVLVRLSSWSLVLPDASPAPAEDAQLRQERLERQLNAVRAQFDRLHDLLEQGVYDPPTFLRRQRALVEREERLRACLSEPSTDPAPPPAAPGQILRRLAPRIRTVLDAYAFADSPADKNLLLRSVIARMNYAKPRRRYKNESEFAAITLDIFPNSPPDAPGR